MPFLYTSYEARLTECDQNLANLFPKDSNLDSCIESVQKYYRISYQKIKPESADTLLKNYEEFVSNLRNVKNGQFDAANMEKIIYEMTDTKKLDIVFANIRTAATIAFLASSLLTLYASIFLFALPMLLVQPILGASTAITISGLLLKTTYDCIQYFSEFRSWTRHNEEESNEFRLVQFFKAKKAEPEESRPLALTAE